MAIAELQDRKFARFVPIYAIESTNETFIRTLGVAKSFKPDSMLMELEYDGCTVQVDIQYIQPFPYKQGSKYLFIGDLISKGVSSSGHAVLKAQLYRRCDGLNMEQYHRVQELRSYFQ